MALLQYTPLSAFARNSPSDVPPKTLITYGMGLSLSLPRRVYFSASDPRTASTAAAAAGAAGAQWRLEL